MPCLFVAACLTPGPKPHPVSYPISDVPILTGGPLSQYALVVRSFADARPGETLRRTASDGRLTKVWSEEKSWYATSDDRFETAAPVSHAVTEAIATHLRASELFRSVQVNDADPPPGNLVLTGNVVQFEGLREERDTSETLVGMQGLVGVALKATQSAALRARTRLGQVTLARVGANEILWQGDVEGVVDEEVDLKPGVAEKQALEAATRSLRRAVDQLMRQLAVLEAPTAGGAR